MSTSENKKSKVKPLCRRHNGEPVTVFSAIHGQCMCLKCAMEQHDHLSDFMPISEGVEMMKATGKSLVEEINMMSEMTRSLKKDRTKGIERIRVSDKNIKAEIRKTKDKIRRELDLMEQKLTNNLKVIMERSERVYLKDQTEFYKIDSQLKKIKENLQSSMKTSSGLELISGIMDEKSALLQKKAEVRRLQESMPPKQIQFRISDSILDFFENLKDLGEISQHSLGEGHEEITDKSKSKPQNATSRSYPGSNAHSPLSFKTHSLSPRNTIERSHGYRKRIKYGLHVSNPYHPMNEQFGNVNEDGYSRRPSGGDSSLDLYEDIGGSRDDPVIQSAEHDGPCNLTGVAALTSGRVVVCDSKHKCIQLINRQSEILDEAVFHYKPCDIATLSENEVIVSFIDKDFISVFYAASRTLRHMRNLSVSGRGGSYSVAVSKNKIAVCRRGEVRIFSSGDGDLINSIQIDAHFPQIALSDGGSKIYLSDFVGGKVTCMNELGRIKWEYGQEELEPCSLTVDLNQLFVADVKGEILIMSTYGILIRMIQCHGHLQAITVDPNTGTLLVTEESNRDKLRSRSIKIVSI